MRKSAGGGAIFAICAALGLSAGAARAQDFPGKPVTIYMGFPAGSSLDIVARYYAGRLHKETGQPFIVQNRLGANGTIAMNAMAKSPPDGHTLMFGPGAAAAHVVIRSLGFDPLKDVIPLAGVVAFPFMLIVAPNHRDAKSVAGLAAMLKGRSSISFGSPNSLSRVGGELFSLAHGLKATSVPYKINADTVRDLIAGDLDFIVNEANSSFAMIREGKVRGLAVTLRTRSANAPELPTMTELGYKDFNFHGWMGAYAPAGTPLAVVRKLEQLIVGIGRSKETAEFYRKIGGDVFALDRMEFVKFEQEEFAAWKVRAKIANLTAN